MAACTQRAGTITPVKAIVVNGIAVVVGEGIWVGLEVGTGDGVRVGTGIVGGISEPKTSSVSPISRPLQDVVKNINASAARTNRNEFCKGIRAPIILI
jgi:hypothetical protein